MKIKFILLITLALCLASTPREVEPNIIIKGIQGEVYTNVINRLSEFKAFSSPKHNLNINANILKKQIADAMRPFGYFSPSIRYITTKNNKNTTLTFEINAGQRLVFNEVIYSKELTPYLSKIYKIKPGDFFNVNNYERTKTEIRKKLREDGYANASLKYSNVSIDLKNKHVKATISAYLGNKYKFGTILYNETEVVKSQVEKYLTFNEGDIYTKEKLQKFKDSLLKSGLFLKVNLKPIFKENTNKVDIQIKVSFKPKNEYQVGFGYDTDQKYQITFDATNNYLSSDGDKSNFSFRGSETELKAGYNYLIPGFDPKVETEIISIFLNTKDNLEIGSSKYITSSYTLKHEFPLYTMTKSINIIYEKSEPNDAPEYSSTIIYPSVGFSNKGTLFEDLNYFWSTKILAAKDGLGSNVSMIQAQANSRLVYQLTPYISLTNKISLGAIESDNFTDVPLSFKFTAGGANSIRGYSYNSFGPGKYLKVMSNEIGFKIFDDISFTLFMDIGNVSNSFLDDKYYIGAGPGLSWHTAIGNANISLAYALSYDDYPWKIQFRFFPDP